MARKLTPAESKRLEAMGRFEREAYAEGALRIAGVDEAGRGSWAGPVAAAAVVLPPGFKLAGVDDSKRLSPSKRAALFQPIKDAALAWAVCCVSARCIDARGILPATKKAMRAALLALSPPPDFVLADAVRLDDIPIRQRALIRGDRLSLSIAAASILAKVVRDEAMRAYDSIYAGYGFAGHKGYGVKAHREKLLELGLCPLHRKSFQPMKALDTK